MSETQSNECSNQQTTTEQETEKTDVTTTEQETEMPKDAPTRNEPNNDGPDSTYR
jgi:hypothetical protein